MMKLRWLNKWKSCFAPGFLLLVAILLPIKFAAAATYTLPGSLPSGCTQSSSTSYTCVNLSLGWNDAIVVSNANTTLTITNTLTANGNNINTSSPASGFMINAATVSGSNYLNLNGNLNATNNLTLSSNTNTITGNISAGGATNIGGTITGTVTSVGSLTTQWATTITGNISASSIASGGGSTYGGSLLASSGNIVTGSSDQVAGDLTSSQGGVTLGSSTTVGGSVTAKNTITFPHGTAVTGSVTSTNGDVFVGNANTIGGNVTAKGKVTVSNQAVVTGNAVSENDEVVLESANARVGGDVTAQKKVTLKSSDRVNGNVTSSTQDVVLESSARVDKCVTVHSSKAITLNWHAVVTGGVCCQSGSSCSTSCVSNGSGYAMPGLCVVFPSLSIANVSASEGNSGSSTMTFTITQSATSSQTSTVNYSTSGGTATGGASCTAGVDYVSASGSKTIAPGATTATFTVTFCGDTSYEADETFSVTLASPVNATLGTSTATGTITNDDGAPSLSIGSVSAAEGDFGTSTMTFTVTQSAISGLTSSFNYASSNGAATGGASCTAGVDYITVSGSKTIPAGSTTASIDVQICGDTTTESNETFSLTLSAPTNVTLGTSVGTGTITNDDTATSQCLTQYTFTGNDGDPPGSDWTTTTSGSTSFNPSIYNNRLRLTPATTNVATAAHLQKKFPGAGNKIVVEFDYYAYNGTGADGIALTFSDAAITPLAGAYGGSLGYAQRTSVNGFAGGWLGIGIDEYGNFSNPTEGRDGGTSRTLDSVAVRGSGSGTTGYTFHAGSSTLSPGVDQGGSSQGPGHRYRITIDHSDSLHAYVWVERSTDGGGTYSTIIAKYDAKTKTGQAAVPTEWLLSYTGSTGDSTNIHEIDNLYICAAQPILPFGPSHYVIAHSGTALTCEAEPVTITAHDSSHARASAAGKNISLTTSTGKGTWSAAADSCSSTCYNTSGTAQACTGTLTPTSGNNGQASYLFATGESAIRLCLKHDTAGTVGINVTDGTATENTGSAATEAAPGTDPGLVFSNTGLRFYADGSVDTLGKLVAGLRSDVTDVSYQPSPQALTIRAVKSSETSPARCVSLLGSASNTVKFAYQCIDPATCQLPSGLEVNSAVVAGSAGVPTPASDVTVSFDASGYGTINLKYLDVGQIKLYASAAVVNPVGGGTVSIANGSSNTFVVNPYKLAITDIKQTVSPYLVNQEAADATGNKFLKAGESFSATITAVNASCSASLAGYKLYSDIPTSCITPSFGLGSQNGAELVTLSHDLVSPTSASGGAPGDLAGTKSILRNAFSSGVKSVTDLTWSEVGVMTLTATNSAFEGVTLSPVAVGTSGNVGRFIPHHFGVTGSVVSRSDQQTVEGQAAPFTYMGEPMKLSLAVTAYSKMEGKTNNYTASFAKLDVATLGSADLAKWTCTSGAQCMGLAAVSGSTDLTSRLLIDTTSTNSAVPSNTTTLGGATSGWSGGDSYFTLYSVFRRAAVPDGPYSQLKVGAKPLDSDGVTLPPRTSTDTGHCVNLDVTTGVEAIDCDPGPTEANLRRKLFETSVRFGRLWLGNVYGSDRLPLRMPYELQHWNGFAFVKNNNDSLTALATGNIAMGNKKGGLVGYADPGIVVSNPTALRPGAGMIELTKDASATAGSIDLVVNLGSASVIPADPENCPNLAYGTSTSANLAYLSGKWCGASYDRDPTARATFGVFGSSLRKGPIYIRENF